MGPREGASSLRVLELGHGGQMAVALSSFTTTSAVHWFGGYVLAGSKPVGALGVVV